MATRAWAKLHSQTMSYQGIPAMYKLSCQACVYLKPAYILLSVTHSLPCHAIVRLTIVQKVAVCAASAFNLDHLCSRFLSRRPCSLTVALHTCSHGLAEVHISMDIVKY